MARIGIFSGTFDPVHNGHVEFALEAAERCGFAKVFFLAELEPRGKTSVTPVGARQTMIQMAIADYPDLDLFSLPSKQFSAHETLPLLQQRFAGNRLSLLIGSDVVRSIANWPDVTKLVSEMDLVVGLRRGDAQRDVQALLAQLDVPVKTTFIETAFQDIAASAIRQGQPAEDALHPDVQAYIATAALYD